MQGKTRWQQFLMIIVTMVNELIIPLTGVALVLTTGDDGSASMEFLPYKTYLERCNES